MERSRMELCRADWVLKLRGKNRAGERDREMRGLEVRRRMRVKSKGGLRGIGERRGGDNRRGRRGGSRHI